MPVTSTVLDRLVRAIVDEVDPEQVILFGSQATGAATSESDLDLLVVEGAPFGPQRSRRRELIRIRKALSGFNIPVDVLVFGRDEVEYWRDSLNHVIGRALREGNVLYERQ